MLRHEAQLSRKMILTVREHSTEVEPFGSIPVPRLTESINHELDIQGHMSSELRTRPTPLYTIHILLPSQWRLRCSLSIFLDGGFGNGTKGSLGTRG